MTCVTTGSTPFDLDWFPATADPDVADTHDELPTLAGQLQFQQGFRTSLLTANAIMGPLIGLDRGFQNVDNLDATTATVITDAAIEEARTLAADDGSPFYLHVHFVDPHSPYCPPDEFIDPKAYEPFPDDLCDFDVFWSMAAEYPTQSSQWRDQFMGDSLEVYAAEIEYWDAEFARMWDGFEAAGALDDTLVVFVTDHGEQFYERGGWLHGTTLTAEENRAVAMFWADDIVPVTWTEPTVHEDLGATVMDFFGVAPPEPATGIVVGTAPADRAVRGMLYWNGGGAAQLSIVQGDLQLTYGFWGEKHLWDYSLDPLGLVDYYDPNDPDVQALWVPMEAYINEVLKQWPSAGPVTDPGP
jgi:Sulfatase